MGLTTRHFESVPCPRCGGSGRHSFTERYGDTCFKCGGKPFIPGSGWALTKAGAAALAAFDAANREEIAAGDVKVGDVLTFGTEKFRVDEIATKAGTADDSFGGVKSGDGPWVYHALMFVRVHNVTGQRMSRSMNPGDTVTRLTPGRFLLPPEMEPGTDRRAEMRAYVKAAEAAKVPA